MPSNEFCYSESAPKSMSAGASSQTQLREFTALSRLPSWCEGASRQEGMGLRKEKGGDEGKRNGGKGGREREEMFDLILIREK